MATLAAAAIIQAVRDVGQAAHGSARTIASGTYQGASVFDRLEANAASLRSLDAPALDARIDKVGRHPSSPIGPGSSIIYSLAVSVRVVRHEGLEHDVSTSARDALIALAAADGATLAQALEYPGNLTQTAAAAPTGLVSGLLKWLGSSVASIEDRSVVTTHSFEGAALVTP